MVTEDCLNRVLPVVADSWAQLRRSDVDRLLNQIHYDNKASLLVAAGIVATKRPDLQKQIDESVGWITEERGFAATPKIINGLTDDKHKNRFHQRSINDCQILVQINARGEWHGYVGQIYKTSFNSESEAVQWLTAYPMVEVA